MKMHDACWRVIFRGAVSAATNVSAADAAPALFTSNESGTGQAANPVKIGGYISLFAAGEGQTLPAGVDGKLMGPAASVRFCRSE
jgi:uncharacterized protein (TIGR03437 family)